MEMTTKEKASVLLNEFEQLDSLKGLQHQGLSHIPPQGNSGERYEVYFSNDKQRAVEFTFYPEEKGKPDYLVVYLIDEATDQDFSLDAWLQKQGEYLDKSPFSLASYQGEFEEKVNSVARFINSCLLRPELTEVLQGASWLDVQFNWGESR